MPYRPMSASRYTTFVALLLAVLLTSIGLMPRVASSQQIFRETCEEVISDCPSGVTDDPAITSIHPHGKRAVWRMSTSIPSSWRDSVKEAAKAWTDRTTYTFSFDAMTSSTDWTDTTTHIVWRGAIPSTWTFCTSTALGCTKIRIFSGTKHIADADTIINESKTMGTNTFNCALGQIDVQTLMVHEFGHWGHLDHTDKRGNAMWGTYDGCRRLPTGYDQALMEYNFVKGGHTAP